MRRFLPTLAALLLLLTLCACTKPSEEPTPSPAPPTEETKKLAVTVNPNGEKQRLFLECPADWESEYGCISCEGRPLVDFYADTAESIQNNYLQRHDDIQTKRLGEREFQTYTEEYMGKEAVPGESEARRVPYESFSYYFAEDGIGYLIRLEQSKEREQVISITDFEEILAGLEIEKPLETTENAVGYEKMELGGFSLWLPEGTTCEDGSLRNEQTRTEFLATVPTVEAITDKEAPFAAYDETYSDAYRVEEHKFGGYAAKSYYRSWEEPDAALPMKMHEVIYCIDTGDEMIRLTLTPLIGLGISVQCEMFEKILNSIEVG